MPDILANDTSDMSWSEVFAYDESSRSCLRWAVDRYSGDSYQVLEAAVGDSAGWLTSKGYYAVKFNHKSYLCHRVIWELFNPPLKPTEMIDHINRDKSDNRISNLRVVTKAENNRNRKKSNTNKTGVTGVCRRDVYDKNGKCNTYYIAQGTRLDGTRVSANFNVAHYGEEEAFRLACEQRKKMVEALNQHGAGYTEQHGT